MSISTPWTVSPTRLAPSHVAYRAATYFASLDVLRAIAILAVVWHHTAALTVGGTLSDKGYHGVTLFFAISGFLIVTLLLREKEATGTISMRGFMIKRALRILPLYYGTLALYCVATFAFERDAAARALFWQNLPYFLTFTSNWLEFHDAPRIIFVFAWSLAAEEQFYLIWPWIERLKLGRHVGLCAALLAVGLSPSFAGALWPASEPQPFILMALSRLPGAIGLGVVMAHLLHSPVAFRWLRPLIGRRGSAMTLLLLLLVVLAYGGVLGRAELAVIDILCALLVGAAVIDPANDLAALARVPWLTHIGVVSYGLYLLHMLAASAVKTASAKLGFDAGVPLFLSTLLIGAALATLSHRTFERWFLSLRKHLLPQAPAA